MLQLTSDVTELKLSRSNDTHTLTTLAGLKPALGTPQYIPLVVTDRGPFGVCTA